MKPYIKFLVFSFMFLFVSHASYAQMRTNNMPSGTIASESVFLDASSSIFGGSENNGKGLLFPRTDLTMFTFKTDGNTLSFPSFYDGTIVYNTATGTTPASGSGVGGESVTPGFYYFSNPTTGSIENTGNWIPFAATTSTGGDSLWEYNGTEANLKTLSDGSTARTDVNNVFIGDDGKVGIGTSSPSNTFVVVNSTAQDGTADAIINDITVGKGYDNIATNTAVGVDALASSSIQTGYINMGYANTAFGHKALTSNERGYNNTAVGKDALYSNVAGSENVAVGADALYYNTGGDGNSAIGWGALHTNIDGRSNVAIGGGALYSNTIGDENTAIGKFALFSNDDGEYNVANGFESLYSNTTGDNNVANGFQALYSNTIGGLNVANGSQALYSNTSGSHNVANGSQALYSNTSGVSNVANGYQSLYSNSEGAENTANGKHSLRANTSGHQNVANGYQALYFNGTGSGNSANGFEALYSNLTGGLNVANGFQALHSNTLGNNNTASGYRSLYGSTTGSNGVAIGYESQRYAYETETATPWDNTNVSVGYQALRGSTTAANNTGKDNSVLGYQALMNNTEGEKNVAVGTYSLYYNTTGKFNSAFGYETLQKNTTGFDNVAVGISALFNNTTGVRNIGIGRGALYKNTDGWQNIVIGYNAGLDINNVTATGNNTIIGHETGLGIETGINNTIIGANVNGLANTLSNTIIIADGSGNQRIYVNDQGQVGIGGTIPRGGAALDVGDDRVVFAGGYFTVSDMRYKTNIQELTDALDIVLKLRGVRHDWKQNFADKNFPEGTVLGLIAQEVESYVPEVVHTDHNGYKSVDYSKLAPLLIEAIQSQQEQINAQEARLKRIEKELGINY